MKIQETLNQGLKRQYRITVPAAELAGQVENRLQAIGGQMKLPGFRPGHVPASLIRQRHGKEVLTEVIDHQVQHLTQEVLKEKNLRIAVLPKAEVKVAEEGKDLDFEITLEVFPDVPEIDYQAVSLTKPVAKIGEDDVTEGLSRLAKRTESRTKADAKHKAKNGDVVVIDFTGKKNGVAFEGGTATKFRLELGSDQFIPGFEPQLVGVKAGDEKTIEVTFPESYHAPDLAGQAVTFDIVVHEIEVAGEQKMDDDFAKKLGFESLEALKGRLREFAENENDQLSRSHAKKALFDQLENAYTFEVPEGMVEAEFKQIWEQLKSAREQGDPSLQKPEDELKKEYDAIARRRVRLGLLLAETGRRNTIEVPQEKINAAIVEQARQFPGQEQKIFDFFRNNPEHVSSIKSSLLEEEVVDFLLGKVAVKEQQVSREQLAAFDEDAPAEQPKAKKAKAETADVAEKPKAKKKAQG